SGGCRRPVAPRYAASTVIPGRGHLDGSRQPLGDRYVACLNTRRDTAGSADPEVRRTGQSGGRPPLTRMTEPRGLLICGKPGEPPAVRQGLTGLRATPG